jgi:hypothetical protein
VEKQQQTTDENEKHFFLPQIIDFFAAYKNLRDTLEFK